MRGEWERLKDGMIELLGLCLRFDSETYFKNSFAWDTNLDYCLKLLYHRVWKSSHTGGIAIWEKKIQGCKDEEMTPSFFVLSTREIKSVFIIVTAVGERKD